MSPRSESKNEEIRQETMQKIMTSAFQLIAKQGYESTSIAQIAKAAGVSKGLMYNYFDSKEHLLERLIEDAMSQADHVMASILTTDPANTLENLFRWFFKELRERPDFWRMITELTLKVHQFKFVHDVAIEKYNGYIILLENLLEQMEVPDAAAEAKIIAAVFDGIGIQYLIMENKYPLADLEQMLINKYCKKNQKS